MTEEAYLIALITAMIAEDGDALEVNGNSSKCKAEYIRILPALSMDFYNPRSAHLKAEFSILCTSNFKLNIFKKHSMILKPAPQRSCFGWYPSNSFDRTLHPACLVGRLPASPCTAIP
jgi:hypothetical protein